MVEENFIITAKAKSKVFMVMIIGAVLFGIGVIGAYAGWENFDPSASGHGHATVATESLMANHEAEHGEHAAHDHAAHAEHGHDHGHAYSPWKRIVTDLWHNNMFFVGIAIAAIFFYAVNYVAWAGWSAAINRVFLAFGWFLPIGALLTIGVFFIGYHELFHWTHDGIMDPEASNYDPIIAGKEWYLNMPFYIGRMVVFFGAWILFWFFLKRETSREDLNGGTTHYDKLIRISAGFLVFFGVSSSMCSWDWIMSIDTHWFSTLFGWWVFSSWFVSALCAITLTVIWLKEAGYLKIVNQEHLHDLGKFMFAFSIFWSYLWFSQFILYYYSNIPEEVVYFIDRLFYSGGNYKPLFILNLIINFLFPFLFLMTRDAKRFPMLLKVAAFVILAGHWIDTYLMITPGILKEHGGLSLGTLFLELGLTLIYTGIFIFSVMKGLSKLPLIPKNHPMLDESIHHHT